MTVTRERPQDLPAFRVYAASRIVAWFGNFGSAVALPVLVYQLTNSPLLTGLLAAAESLPYLLFGVHVGALVDRWDGKRVMAISATITAGALATVPIAAALDRLTAPHLLLVALVGGVSYVFLDAAAFGTLPRIVGRALIGPATAFLGAAATLLGIIVPGVVGILLPIMGTVPIVAVDAVLCLSSAVLLGRVSLLDTSSAPPRPGVRLREDIREGLGYIWHHPVIRPLTLLGFANAFTGGAVLGLIVVLGVEHLDFTEDDGRFGVIYAVSAIGAFIGATALPRLQRRIRVGVISQVGYGLMALIVVGWSTAGHWVPAAACLAMEGLVGTLIILNGIVARQTCTPLRLQGRVNTTARVIAWGGSPLGAALGGVLAEAYGVGPALLVCTVPVAGAFVGGLWWRLPSVGLIADFPDPEPTPAPATGADSLASPTHSEEPA